MNVMFKALVAYFGVDRATVRRVTETVFNATLICQPAPLAPPNKLSLPLLAPLTAGAKSPSAYKSIALLFSKMSMGHLGIRSKCQIGLMLRGATSSTI